MSTRPILTGVAALLTPTKSYPQGDIHANYNPYEGPYEAFMNFMNVLNDFSIRLNQSVKSKYSDQSDIKEIELAEI